MKKVDIILEIISLFALSGASIASFWSRDNFAGFAWFNAALWCFMCLGKDVAMNSKNKEEKK